MQSHSNRAMLRGIFRGRPPLLLSNRAMLRWDGRTGYQQTGTPDGFVAGMPVGRAAVPEKMPHFCEPGMVT